MNHSHFSHAAFTVIKLCIGSIAIAGKLLLMLPFLLQDK